MFRASSAVLRAVSALNGPATLRMPAQHWPPLFAPRMLRPAFSPALVTPSRALLAAKKPAAAQKSKAVAKASPKAAPAPAKTATKPAAQAQSVAKTHTTAVPAAGDFASPFSLLGLLFNQPLRGGWYSDLEKAVGGFMNTSLETKQTDKSFIATLKLPGVDPTNVHLEVRDGVLAVWGQASIDKDQKATDSQPERFARYSGSFSKTVLLPFPVDEANTTAKFKDGVLTVTMPKLAEKKPLKIEIEK